MDWEQRVQELENEGLTRSDAQAVADAEGKKHLNNAFAGLERAATKCKSDRDMLLKALIKMVEAYDVGQAYSDTSALGMAHKALREARKP